MATDEEISVVEGYGGDADEDLARARCGLGDFLDLDAVMNDACELQESFCLFFLFLKFAAEGMGQ